jgi:hypothetical protein
MKKLITLLVLALTIPAFASDVVGHAAKDTGKGSAKVASVTAKDTAHVGKGLAKVASVTAKDTAKGATRVVRFLF